MVPVGKRTLGRMFDVFGNTIDHLKLLAEGEKRNIHQAPPPLVLVNWAREQMTMLKNEYPADFLKMKRKTPKKSEC